MLSLSRAAITNNNNINATKLYTSPGPGALTNSSMIALEGSPQWRTMMDNCMVEFISTLFLILATIFCWGWKTDDAFMQFIPALTMGLVLLCLKDEDYFFPDASWTVTLVLWALGGYGSWTHVIARMVGQSLALAVAVWICGAATIPAIIVHVEQPMAIVFVLEAFATMLEHMAVVYVIMPLLPPSNSHGANFLFPKVRPKSDHLTKAPSNPVVMHAAATFASLHWCLWRAFGTEMNPAITIVLAYLRKKQQHAAAGPLAGSAAVPQTAYTAVDTVDPWHHATIAVWGQIVGLLLCIVYAAVYVPRETKLWRPSA